MTGWGSRRAYNHTRSVSNRGILQEVNVTVVSNTECQEAYSGIEIIKRYTCINKKLLNIHKY